jgi:hypothetical protein
MPGNEDRIAKVKDNPEMLDEMQKLFAGFPQCIRSVPALIAKFDCLQVEGSALSDSARALSEKGYKPTELDQDRICKLTTDEINGDSKAAAALRTRTGELLSKFDDTAKCRIEVDKWLGSRSSAGGTGSLEASMDRVTKQFEKDLEPAKATELGVKNLAPELKKQLEDLKAVMFTALVACRS